MPREPSPSASRDLRALFDAGTTAGLSDEQLLRRYVDRRAEAEAAFASLVDRHGPMVWGVCRRALKNAHEAEDAFQATFLVLARRAGSVRVDGSLGRWLHGVAAKVAARARVDHLRRPAREARAATAGPSSPDPERDELLAALDEELGRLPEKYRSPVILCHLEGLTYAGAAEQLGCPPGAIKGRLARARELLRARLTRRGLGLPESTTESPIFPEPRPAVPAVLAASTARLGSAIARPAVVAGVSTSVLTLTNGVIRTMFLIRSAKILALLAPASASASAGLWFLAAGPAPEGKEVVVQAPAAEAKRPVLPRADLAAVDEPDRPSNAIAVPLPGRDDLHGLLRRAAEEAVAVASKQPDPSSWALMRIARALALAGDPAGARETFAIAAREAGGDFGGRPHSWNLWYVGHAQAEVGFLDDARPTLRRALENVPGLVGEINKDSWALHTLAIILKDQVRIGARDEALRTADRLKAFAQEVFTKSSSSNAEEFEAPSIAEALAAVGDFEGAFRRAGAVQHTDQVVGKAALAATKYLDRAEARRFVDEAVTRMAGITSADRKYMGLQDLAEAQARIGDLEGAKRSARSIGEGPTGVNYDMTDGQPYAMLLIAIVQLKARDVEGVRETLREGYRMIIDHPKMRGPEGRLFQIASVQVIGGDIEGALRSAESMPEGRRSETLAKIARAQAMAGKAEEARKTIDRALADARGNVKTPPPPAPETPITAVIKPFPPDVSAIMHLAEVQAMAGDTVGALKSLGAIGDENYRRTALIKVVSARAAAGDVKGALDLAVKDAKTPGERRAALEAVGQGVETRLLLESPERAGD